MIATMKKIVLTILTSLPFLAGAQDAYTLKFLPQLAQSQRYNATNQSDVKITVGLPVISNFGFYIYNSGFSYNDLFHRVNDSTIAIHPADFINNLKDKNVLAFGANTDIFSVNLGYEDFTVGFSIADRVDARFTYPKDLFRFAWYGNGAYIGKSLNIGNFGLNASWYREYALHGTKNVGKWTFGASPKLLFGKTNIHTKTSYLQLYTAPDYYALTAMTEFDVQTSGISDSTDKAEGNMQFPQYAFNSKNVGLGLDLGAKYQVKENLSIAAGINNLGYINWRSNIHNYTAGPTSFSFEGFQLENFISTGDSNFISTSTYLDSVKDMIKYSKNTDAYSTTLPYELYAIGMYDFNDMHHGGAQISMQRFNKKFIYDLTLNYRLDLSKHFTAALTYTLKSGSAFNIGGALIARFAGMQWYMATDNWWASVKPLSARNTNISMGVNLAFGDRVKKKIEVSSHPHHPIGNIPESTPGEEADDEPVDGRPADAPAGSSSTPATPQ